MIHPEPRLTHKDHALALVGEGLEVPLVTGDAAAYVNLDFAASTPPLTAVAEAVDGLLPWYSSVHRGTGFKSVVSTTAYEWARASVADFVGARHDDVVLFTRNTTDAINLLDRAMPPGTCIVTFAGEHHANLLPWRRREAVHLPIPLSREEAIDALDRHLAMEPHDGPRLVAITGASNVTGEIWPIEALAEVAHRHGARIFVDAAQLVAHTAATVSAWDVDYVAFSGHKIYAPFGAGVLVGRPDWLLDAAPYLAGGGAVKLVTTDDVVWEGLPDRQEAGSPNVVGAYALGVACRELAEAGMEALANVERDLAAYAIERLRGIDGLTVYRTWPEEEARVGLITMNLDGYDHGLVAAILSAEHGIGVRNGCFCAHPLLVHLLRIDDTRVDGLMDAVRRGGRPPLPGAFRMSLGVGSTVDDVDRLMDALGRIARSGPAWTYRRDAHGDYVPDPDTRAMPALRPVREQWNA